MIARGGAEPLSSYSQPIGEQSLRDLHPNSVEEPSSIRRLLDSARAEGSVFHRGLNGLVDLEVARLESVSTETLVLEAENFDPRSLDEQIFLNFSEGGRPYFFVTRRTARFDGRRLVLETPKVIFQRERRDRARRPPCLESGESSRVVLEGLTRGPCEAEIRDRSPSGLSLLIEGDRLPQAQGALTARFLDGQEQGQETRWELRSASLALERTGWIRLGLVQAGRLEAGLIPIERWSTLERPDLLTLESPASTDLESASDRPQAIRLPIAENQELVGLLDRWGSARGATAVLMPSGWGQTKEALLPLARTLVSTFKAHGLPVEVVRFDGLHKRGESSGDPACQIPGHESDHFVFSQGVRDIGKWVDYLRHSPEHGADRVILVSFSASAIEARKAIRLDQGRWIDGWISVVGSPDLQSMARSISGGVDYVGGHERGHHFGFQELLGVRVDIDRIAVDAKQHEMSFLEDSRQDLALTRTPITWFHGAYDGWVDLERVRDILSQGDLSHRRLIEIPTGHQLRTSQQAKLAFESISREVARLALGRDLRPVSPAASEVRQLRVAESRRLPDVETNLQAFWRDYLVGRDGSLGIELLTASSAYRSMMAEQLACLDWIPGLRVADLGAGTGALALALADSPTLQGPTTVFAMDYVHEGLRRATKRLDERKRSAQPVSLRSVEVDLDVSMNRGRIPVMDGSFDRVVASLLIGYVEHPDQLLTEMYRVLRPGGRIVVSTLCRDADISRLYRQAFEELEGGAMTESLPELEAADRPALARNFLNDAARILELEDAGAFEFMDAEDLSDLASGAGFVEIETRASLGTPPQAVILSAARPVD